jgi:hypothetical protein
VTTLVEDVLLALEEAAAETKNAERAGLLLAAHNRLVQDSWETGGRSPLYNNNTAPIPHNPDLERVVITAGAMQGC